MGPFAPKGYVVRATKIWPLILGSLNKLQSICLQKLMDMGS